MAGAHLTDSTHRLQRVFVLCSQGTYDGARRPLPVKFIGSEIYSKGQGITAVFQADLLGEPTHSRTHGAETSTPRTGLGGDGRTPVEAMSGV